MVDLPRHAVVVAGLEHWTGFETRPVVEPRLQAKLEALLGVSGLRLFAPPVEPDDPRAPRVGIPAFVFPEWFIASYERWEAGRDVVSRPLVHTRALESGRYRTPDGKRVPVVPVRFVQGCLNGHLSDIDWHGFVHEYAEPRCLRPLWFEDRGTSGDLADLWVVCECTRERSMAQAAQRDLGALGYCTGERPWLGRQGREKCGGADGPAQRNRLLLRAASDAYFAHVQRVISIPEPDAAVRAGVEIVWQDHLSFVESLEDLRRERRRPRVAAALEGLGDDEVWAEIQSRRGERAALPASVKQAEIETLLKAVEARGDEQPGAVDFHARRVPHRAAGVLRDVERVVLVSRLREVSALTGFTRFEAPVPDIDGELTLDVRRADLAGEVNWLPAVENRGEGFFFALRPEAVEAWLRREAVIARGEQLRLGHDAWLRRHPGVRAAFPGLPYVLLHSLSHLLLTAVALECGYAASSIRERVYATEAGCGLLLYTASPDSEGTLGGLVRVGRDLERHLSHALRLGALCSSDPVCAQHRPEHAEEERFLQGAACHGCVLIAEPSCERRNDHLDRALVVPTVDTAGAAFFEAAALV